MCLTSFVLTRSLVRTFFSFPPRSLLGPGSLVFRRRIHGTENLQLQTDQHTSPPLVLEGKRLHLDLFADRNLYEGFSGNKTSEQKVSLKPTDRLLCTAVGPLPGPLDSRPDNEMFLPFTLIIPKDAGHREGGITQFRFDVCSISTWMERGRNSPPSSSELNLAGA